MYPTYTVESLVERSLGKAAPGGHPQGKERFEIRWWLSTMVNGKQVDSRGTTAIVVQPSLADARQFARYKAAHIQSNLETLRLEAGIANFTAKDANAALPKLVERSLADDADFQQIIDELGKPE